LATLTEDSPRQISIGLYWTSGRKVVGSSSPSMYSTVRSGSPSGVSEASYLPTTCRASPSVPPTPCGRNTTNGYAKSSAR
jgi:hypothetical protein